MKPKSFLIKILSKMLNNGVQARRIVRAQRLNNGCFNVTGNNKGWTLKSILQTTQCGTNGRIVITSIKLFAILNLIWLCMQRLRLADGAADVDVVVLVHQC